MYLKPIVNVFFAASIIQFHIYFSCRNQLLFDYEIINSLPYRWKTVRIKISQSYKNVGIKNIH